MRKRSAEEKQKQLERFLMNVAEAADAALWEYWGGDRGSYTSPTLPCGSYPFVNLREANTLLRKLFTSRKSE